VVYYVALHSIEVGVGLAPGEAIECPSGGAAIRRAQAMALNEVNARAVAFSRSGDPNLGEFEDAVILKPSERCRRISRKRRPHDLLSQSATLYIARRSQLGTSSRTTKEYYDFGFSI
jgi:hypothetical protein